MTTYFAITSTDKRNDMVHHTMQKMPWFWVSAMILSGISVNKNFRNCVMILCEIAIVLGALSLKFAIAQIQKMPCQKIQNCALPIIQKKRRG